MNRLVVAILLAATVGGCAHMGRISQPLRPPVDVPEHFTVTLQVQVVATTSPNHTGAVQHIVEVPGHYVAGKPLRAVVQEHCDHGAVYVDGRLEVRLTRMGEDNFYDANCKEPLKADS